VSPRWWNKDAILGAEPGFFVKHKKGTTGNQGKCGTIGAFGENAIGIIATVNENNRPEAATRA
jgi:hypothetical protein